MKKSLATLLASAAGLGVLFSSITVTEAHAKPRPYTFGNGTMYTIEFKESDSFPQTVRLGTVGRSGRVTAVSDDWGLASITSADYSPDTGLVYILARALLGSSSEERCTVMTWDPATPSVDPVTFFELPGTRVSCQSLYVGEGIIVWARERGNLSVGHLEIFSVSSGEYSGPSGLDGTFSWPIVGISGRSDGKILHIGPDGNYALAFLDTPVERRIRGLRDAIRDAQFDQRDRAWVMGQRTASVSRLGVLSFKSRKVSWGNVLRDSVTRQVWNTDSMFFVPTAAIG